MNENPSELFRSLQEAYQQSQEHLYQNAYPSSVDGLTILQRFILNLLHTQGDLMLIQIQREVGMNLPYITRDTVEYVLTSMTNKKRFRNPLIEQTTIEGNPAFTLTSFFRKIFYSFDELFMNNPIIFKVPYLLVKGFIGEDSHIPTYNVCELLDKIANPKKTIYPDLMGVSQFVSESFSTTGSGHLITRGSYTYDQATRKLRVNDLPYGLSEHTFRAALDRVVNLTTFPGEDHHTFLVEDAGFDPKFVSVVLSHTEQITLRVYDESVRSTRVVKLDELLEIWKDYYTQSVFCQDFLKDCRELQSILRITYNLSRCTSVTL